MKNLSAPVLPVESSSGAVRNPLIFVLQLLIDGLLQTHSSKKPQSPQQAMRRVVTRPNCTHIVMMRAYGTLACHICGRVPDFGWLYVCQQDQQAVQTPHPNDSDASSSGGLYSIKEDLQLTDLRKATDCPIVFEMVALGFSRSVVENARNGLYTAEQLQILVTQKKRMWETLHAQEAMRNVNDALMFAMSGNFKPTPTSAFARSMSSPGRRSSVRKESPARYRLRNNRSQAAQCTFQVCHGCRPYYIDRCFTSFEAVFAAEEEPITETESRLLPVRDVGILRKIGLRVPRISISNSSGLSTISTMPTQSISSEEYEIYDEPRAIAEDLSFADLSSRRNVASAKGGLSSSRTQLKRTLSDILRDKRLSSSSDQSNVTLPLEGTGALRDLDECAEDFDISLFRKINRGDTLSPLTHSLRRSTTRLPLRPIAFEDASFYGEEVEVDGGVALTEEAVETHTPDIITQV
ncbi:hypothetical protein NA57DRAFT_51241 [Rhizodiscina lignyota]|uniref:Uncharacterized protein n=1 Tax=Rhizodiscina lignyota TaxID=1504668 RepID=A0A9P4INL3_9PEZI|nr:hypothetical protein NA57DRAFT_51241 [Rhizodiscina lignyota]